MIAVHFLWEEDSIASWVANIILAFIIIKFAVYPILGLMLATSHPIVAVVSGSMEHDGWFSTWWGSDCCLNAECSESWKQKDLYSYLNISEKEFKSYSFTNGLNKGDIMLLRGVKNIKRGDVIVFQSAAQSDPIIHRVIDTNPYQTKGDHNCGSSGFESNIPPENIIGKAWLRLPLLGWVKIAFVKLLSFVGLAQSP